MFCYKVSLYEFVSVSCISFTGLSVRAKMVGGGPPLKGKFSS